MLKSDKKNILLILTGSIACYKACTVMSRLKQKGYTVKTVMSPASLEFVGKATVEGLTGIAPITDMYESGNVMDHINLARWADLILVAPATANYINKIAAGIGDDLLTTLFLAHDFEKPLLLAPAMNTKMYLHPVTQQSITRLKNMNVSILETASGVLACGEVGSGRLLDPELIVEEVEAHLKKPATIRNLPERTKGSRVLITFGGTSEPIDDVRVITNKSTGKTGAALADLLTDSGFDVVCLAAKNAVLPKSADQITSFETYSDLEKKLAGLLSEKFDWVIHAAAVSDYSVVPQTGKISSDAPEITLTLKKNPKLLDQIKKLNPAVKTVAFKLTSAADETLIQKKVMSLFESSSCDVVIQNDWKQVSEGNPVYRIYCRNKAPGYSTAASIQDLGAFLFQTIIQNKEMDL